VGPYHIMTLSERQWLRPALLSPHLPSPPPLERRDSELAPRGYLYRRSCQLPDGRVPVTLRSAHGCTCAGLSQAASASHCSAMAERHCSCAGAYTADGRLLELTQSGNECTGAVHECGPVCNCCAQTCSARVSQVRSRAASEQCRFHCHALIKLCAQWRPQRGVRAALHVEKGAKVRTCACSVAAGCCRRGCRRSLPASPASLMH